MRVELKLPKLGIEKVMKLLYPFGMLRKMKNLKKGKILWKFQTNNAKFNVPATISGRLIEITVQEGDVIAIIETEEDDHKTNLPKA